MTTRLDEATARAAAADDAASTADADAARLTEQLAAATARTEYAKNYARRQAKQLDRLLAALQQPGGQRGPPAAQYTEPWE